MINSRFERSAQRMSYGFLCLVPFLAGTLGAWRALRVPGVYQLVGGVLFVTIWFSAWNLTARGIRTGGDGCRMRAIAGGLLLIPFALISLLWVGLSTPWDATPTENQMRYLVLLVALVSITGGFVVLKQSLCDAGERLYSTLGFGASIMSGAAYLVWLAFQVGAWTERARTGAAPLSAMSLNDSLDTLLFVACVLTYLATAAFAASFGRVGWLGRVASRAFVTASLAAFVFISVRGLAFPDPTQGSSPWYTRPGFIAGIPAVPWILPHLLGVILLRRTGNEPAGPHSKYVHAPAIGKQ